jgi:2-polyprenyl-3-methyl-5-hydroxy-6-metoxy-1,4-benzoquinol methylase
VTAVAPPDLRTRAVDLVELMDDPDCDLAALRRTYAVFPLVNSLAASRRRAWAERIRPLATSAGAPTTLLDLGSGGGDLARALARWAERDGLALSVTAVDPDERAHAFASARPRRGVEYRRASSGDLVAAGETFDVVVSNHVLHHLDDPARAAVLADSERLARRLVLHSDIRRSRAAYGAYAVGTLPLAGSSFVRTDGLRSIRRSFTADELRAVAPARWRVLPRPPMRLWLTWEPLRAPEGQGGVAVPTPAGVAP